MKNFKKTLVLIGLALAPTLTSCKTIGSFDSHKHAPSEQMRSQIKDVYVHF